MADDVVGVVLVLLEEVADTREGDLVDILVDLFLSHADTMIADGDRALVGIETDTNSQVAQVFLVFALSGKCLHLLGGIDGVRYHLAEENLVIAIEKLFDDGEYILGCNPDVTFLHMIFCFDFIPRRILQKACQKKNPPEVNRRDLTL